MSKAEFLLELLCEEIPANALPGVREQLRTGFEAELLEAVRRLPRTRPFGA